MKTARNEQGAQYQKVDQAAARRKKRELEKNLIGLIQI